MVRTPAPRVLCITCSLTARYKVPLADTLSIVHRRTNAVASAVSGWRVVAESRPSLDAHAAAVSAGAPDRPAAPPADHDRYSKRIAIASIKCFPRLISKIKPAWYQTCLVSITTCCLIVHICCLVLVKSSGKLIICLPGPVKNQHTMT